MAWINKGDLIESRGRRWIALTENYTKLVREWSGREEVELATAMGAVRAVPADGEGGEQELIFSQWPVSVIEKARAE